MQITLYIAGIRLAVAVYMRNKILIQVYAGPVLQSGQGQLTGKIFVYGFGILPKAMLRAKELTKRRDLTPLVVEKVDKACRQQ
jgi:hypothetical protein